MFSFLLRVTCLTSRKQFSENRQFWLRNLRKFENLADVDLFHKNSYLKLLKSRCLKIKIGEFWTTIEKIAKFWNRSNAKQFWRNLAEFLNSERELFSTSRRPHCVAVVCCFLLRGCVFRLDDACQKRFSWSPDWIQKVQKCVNLVDLVKSFQTSI